MINNIKELVLKDHITDITLAYEKNNDLTELSKDNIFAIISNTYYKENFHSDIIYAILSQNNKSVQGLLKLLNFREPKYGITYDNYNNPVITKEDGGIDLLITDENSNHAIIIENKINGAIDQPRQLPRYYDDQVASEKIIDAIVYLSFDGVKSPNTDDWTKSDKKNIQERLIKLPAYKGCINDLCSVFLSNIKDVGSDLSYLTKQYAGLLKLLGVKYNKDVTSMKEFYDILSDSESCKTIRQIVKMYNKTPAYYATTIVEEFQHDHEPFQSVEIYRDNITAFFDKFKIRNSDFAIDIIHQDRFITIDFFDRDYDYDETKENPALTLLNEHKQDLTGFVNSLNSSRYRKSFKFPEEEKEVIIFIKHFLEILKSST